MVTTTEYLWIPIAVAVILGALALCYLLYSIIRLAAKDSRPTPYVAMCGICLAEFHGEQELVSNRLNAHIMATHAVKHHPMASAAGEYWRGVEEKRA